MRGTGVNPGNQALRDAFATLTDEGVSRLYYLPGESQLAGTENGTVDAAHPTDLGFSRMDVVGGKAHEVFNGWLDADEDGAGALTGRRPLEVIGAWRDASDEMDTNVNVLLPNGTWVDVNRDDWARQGFERIGLPLEYPIVDGTYRFYFELFGANRLATVDYQAALGGWTFHYTGPMAGETEHVIDVEVTGGVAREIANTWR